VIGPKHLLLTGKSFEQSVNPSSNLNELDVAAFAMRLPPEGVRMHRTEHATSALVNIAEQPKCLAVLAKLLERNCPTLCTAACMRVMISEGTAHPTQRAPKDVF
jgi:hypothetical protein